MSNPSVMLVVDDPRGLDGVPGWVTLLFFGFIIATYIANSHRRRKAAERHMTKDDWEAQLKANDPDMKQPDTDESL